MSSLPDRLARAQWLSEQSFVLEGITFGLADIGMKRLAAPAIALKKPRAFLETYARVLDGHATRNVLELGLNHGGSAAFFTVLLQPDKLISVDISGPVRQFDELRAAHSIGGRLCAAYQTSQDDEAALSALLDGETNGPLDLVIDDASHQYDLTRRSFEILFPRLRPGGCYVIEDWQWAHAPGFWDRLEQPALSNLLFQLLMISPGHPELIAHVDVHPSMAFVWKGNAPAERQRLDIDALCFMQDRAFTLL